MTAALEGSERSAARPWLHLTPGKEPVPILQEAGWAPGLVWMGGKSRPHQDSVRDRPELFLIQLLHVRKQLQAVHENYYEKYGNPQIECQQTAGSA